MLCVLCVVSLCGLCVKQKATKMGFTQGEKEAQRAPRIKFNIKYPIIWKSDWMVQHLTKVKYLRALKKTQIAINRPNFSSAFFHFGFKKSL